MGRYNTPTGEVYLEKMSARELMKLGPSHPLVRNYMNMKMENAKVKWGNIAAQRTANNLEHGPKIHKWKHVLLERFYGVTDRTYQCIWIMLTPDDFDRAKTFASFSTFRKYLLKGETVLVSPGGQWNTLSDRDTILGTYESQEYKVSKKTILERGLQASINVGIL